MHELVAVYGTLRQDGRLHHVMGVAGGRSRVLGTAMIDGALYEVAPDERDPGVGVSYPCLIVDEPGRVVAELYEIVDPTLLGELDELEGFDAAHPDDGEYHRRTVALHDPNPPHLECASAWAYVYVRRAPDPTRRIVGGDWIAHHA